MVKIPASEEPDDDGPMVITDGTFEQEFHLDRAQAGEFLIRVGEQLQQGTDITLTTDEWELPFEFREPVELEVEFLGYGDRELEIELELNGPRDDSSIDVS